MPREHMLVLGCMYLEVCFMYWNSTYVIYQIEYRLSYKAILHALPFPGGKEYLPSLCSVTVPP